MGQSGHTQQASSSRSVQWQAYPSHRYRPAHWLGAGFGVLTLRTLHRHMIHDLGLASTPAGVGVVALAATHAFAVWCSGGLETALFTWLLLATWVGLVGFVASKMRRPLR